MQTSPRAWRLDEIVAQLGGRLVGDGTLQIRSVATLESAGEGQATFLANPRYAEQLATTGATVVIVNERASARCSNRTHIVADDAYVYFARLSQLLNPTARPHPGIHPSATCSSDQIAASASIGAGAHIGRHVTIGERVVIGPGCWVADGVSIGNDSYIYGNVSIYAGCQIGQRAIVHAGAVIGSDGFGFARERSGAWVKIPQIGRVIIGDDVEIGANTTIDRGALDDTIIGNGTKLDNQIQIAHNVQLGEHCAFAGCVGVAGSAKIGNRVMAGGGAIILGHLEVADDVTVSTGTVLAKSVEQAGVYTATVPVLEHKEWLRNFSHIRHLDALSDKIRQLEKQLAELTQHTKTSAEE